MSHEWTARALCQQVGIELFFPETDHKETKAAYAMARQVCRGCPVRIACLDYALAHESGGRDTRYGLWGGLTPGERVRLSRERKAS